MRDPITLALVGIGGYGNSYVSALLDSPDQQRFRVAGAVDPAPQSCRRLGELQSRRVPVYRSMEELYADQRPAMVILSTPLHLHADQSVMALSRGSHVLCEKPLCVTPGQIEQMKAARDATASRDGGERIVSIGYQWSFSEAIQRLKADVLAGQFGRPRRLRALVLWPRDEAYFRRNRWAGAKTDGDGSLILDSPVNNACAHYLHNLLYLTGDAVDRSAKPVSVTAELYRVHPIQNYDTAALRATLRGGAELLFVVSHATPVRRGPIFSCEFERGTIDYVDKTAGSIISASFTDGTVRNYGSPNDGRDRKLWLTIDAARTGARSLCGIEAAEAHVQCTWAAQQSVSQIATFDPARIRTAGSPGSRKTWVDGLGEALERCYDQFALPSELELDWARPGRAVAVP